MMRVAYIPLCPLGDVICCMNQLERIKALYAPCHLTVFAIPLIAELLRNYRCVDEVVVLKGNVHGDIDLTDFVPPEEEFDVLFNMSYYLDGLRLQDMLKAKARYGSESYYLTPELCATHFDQWVSNEYWQSVTLKRYENVCGQLGETLRLVDPSYDCAFPVLSRETYHVEPCSVSLPERMVLFMPGTSGLAKYWPIGKYLAVARVLKQLGQNPVFVIGPQDRCLEPELSACGFPVLDTLPLPQVADAILHAELILGNDSGPMHFAAAFQRPTVHIFGSSSAFNWYPYREPLHSLVMPSCAGREACYACRKTCIGRISVRQVLEVACRRLGLAMPTMRQVAFFVQSRIGDCLAELGNIEGAAKICAPCEITVFTTAGMMPFFQAYAFADHVILLQGEDTEIPSMHFEAVFNERYDRESAQVMERLDYDKGYGYENVDIPEEVCQKLYSGGYLPLAMWDDVQLRRYTSVSEQAACLMRLVDPDFHCQHPVLGENVLCLDFADMPEPRQPRKSVLFVLGGSYRSKCYPLESYLRLAQEVVVPSGFTPYFILGPEEQDYLPILKQSGYPFLFCGTLIQIAALGIQWIAKRTLAIGNDTGVMHLLKMLDCRTVTLTANDTHFTWEPYKEDRHVVLYAPCSGVERCAVCRTNHCMELIPYERVSKALQTQLDIVGTLY